MYQVPADPIIALIVSGVDQTLTYPNHFFRNKFRDRRKSPHLDGDCRCYWTKMHMHMSRYEPRTWCGMYIVSCMFSGLEFSHGEPGRRTHVFFQGSEKTTWQQQHREKTLITQKEKDNGRRTNFYEHFTEHLGVRFKLPKWHTYELNYINAPQMYLPLMYETTFRSTVLQKSWSPIEVDMWTWRSCWGHDGPCMIRYYLEY